MEHKRFLEAEFILICNDLYKIKNSILDVLYFIEALCQLDDFSELHMKRLIQTALTNGLMPTTRQWVYILLQEKYSIPQIVKWTGYSRQAIYNAKNNLENCILPIHFIHNLTEKDYNTIERFIELIHKFQGIGISNERSKKNRII